MEKDLTFWEIFSKYSYPEYLKLRKQCIALTKEQEEILRNYESCNCK